MMELLCKNSEQVKPVHFRQKAPSQIFDRVLHKPLQPSPLVWLFPMHEEKWPRKILNFEVNGSYPRGRPKKEKMVRQH